MEDTKTTSKNKFAQAMQDAAISHINEDIHGILDNLEKITQEIPAKVEQHVQPLKEGIEALNNGLKAVPIQFDQDFSRKINRVLDVVSEVEAHTKRLNNTIQIDCSAKISNQAEQLAHEFNERIKGYSVISSFKLLFFGFACTVIGGVISGMITWVVIPKLF